ncbi:MAG: hypothetical protein ABGZ17_06275, partial [Planctomycetaceae bacterium]
MKAAPVTQASRLPEVRQRDPRIARTFAVCTLDRITLRSVPNTRMSAFASIDVVDVDNRTRLDKPQ